MWPTRYLTDDLIIRLGSDAYTPSLEDAQLVRKTLCILDTRTFTSSRGYDVHAQIMTGMESPFRKTMVNRSQVVLFSIPLSVYYQTCNGDNLMFMHRRLLREMLNCMDLKKTQIILVSFSLRSSSHSLFIQHF